MAEQSDLDHVTGKTTTGHEWDGIKELNTPLPRWWVITFYLTIVWAVGYWVVYPAWPMLWSHTTGVLHYSSRAEVAVELANLEKIRGDHAKTHESAMLAFGKEGILKNEEIVTVANYVRSLSGLSTSQGYDAEAGAKIFKDNCVACHGDAGKGNQKLGAPDLTDKIWLYGSDEATLIETITNGRAGVMPAWVGRLDPSTIKALTVFVHSLGGGK
jgi:mono/diheme cytochrome c family protein